GDGEAWGDAGGDEAAPVDLHVGQQAVHVVVLQVSLHGSSREMWQRQDLTTEQHPVTTVAVGRTIDLQPPSMLTGRRDSAVMKGEGHESASNLRRTVRGLHGGARGRQGWQLRGEEAGAFRPDEEHQGG